MRLFGLVPVLALMGCAGLANPTIEIEPEPAALPLMQWDHRPEAEEWTETTLTALSTMGSPLLELVPEDIDEWCPNYPDATEPERAAFWAGLLSSLAKHESTWNPRASGGGGAWIGLVQIDPRTARGYGCNAQTAEELKDGSANLSCAVRIAAVTVPRDGYVGTGRKGLAADWGPFVSDRKRQDMVDWTSSQPYCQG